MYRDCNEMSRILTHQYPSYEKTMYVKWIHTTCDYAH